jgi:hypothetical protein
MPINLRLAQKHLQREQVIVELHVPVNEVSTTRASFQAVVAFLKLVDQAVLVDAALYAHEELCLTL